ncbi:MAG: helix-turn-helix domain-containing protein [Crenarchaeota archaeon]|nr:helix-turn-helix domain-containing protein [Thermoproteota archaeon]
MSLLSLTEQQHQLLEQLVRRRNTPQWLATRAMIVLQLRKGASIRQTARRLHLSRNTVRTWLRRWKNQEENLLLTENQADDDFPLSDRITATLSDSQRLGRPPTFSPEAMVQIVAIACEAPQKFSRPITHWTARELAEEAQKQGLVERISPRSVGRFLKSVIPSTTSQPLLAESRHRRPRSV